MTKNELQAQVNVLNAMGFNYRLDYDGRPVRPRLVRVDGDIPISPRLQMSMMYLWLEAFRVAIAEVDRKQSSR